MSGEISIFIILSTGADGGLFINKWSSQGRITLTVEVTLPLLKETRTRCKFGLNSDVTDLQTYRCSLHLCISFLCNGIELLRRNRVSLDL